VRQVFLLSVLTLGLVGFLTERESRLDAQAAPQITQASDPDGLTITCETFCSDTRLRTANARIRWHATTPAQEASTRATGTARLETTVFAAGFEKDLYVSLPVTAGARERQPVAMAPLAKDERPLRAFQFRLLDVEPLVRSEAGTSQQGVVVEDLEPGITYRWRLVVDAAGGRRVSPVVSCEVPVCPADMVPEPPRTPRPGAER
jgi:hypothetical protein